MKRPEVSKDWWKQKGDYRSPIQKPRVNDIIAEEINRVEDLPRLLTKGDAAKALHIGLRTAERLMLTGALGSIKIGRLRFTTPGFIAFYLETQIRKNA